MAKTVLVTGPDGKKQAVTLPDSVTAVWNPAAVLAFGPGLAFDGQVLRAAVKQATVTLPANTRDYSQVVADATVTAASRVQCWIAPHDDADENGPEWLDVFSLVARPGAGTVTFEIALREPASGPVKINYLIGAA